jgi:hypothetical protein
MQPSIAEARFFPQLHQLREQRLIGKLGLPPVAASAELNLGTNAWAKAVGSLISCDERTEVCGE